MSKENVDALKQAIAAPGLDRPDEFFAIFDEDVASDAGDTPGGKVYGRDGVREFFRQWIGTFEDWRFEIRECIDGGSAVFVHISRSTPDLRQLPTGVDASRLCLETGEIRAATNEVMDKRLPVI